MRKQHKHFISELDQFLKKFDAEHPILSSSQKEEIEKHNRSAKLRDDSNRESTPFLLWEDF